LMFQHLIKTNYLNHWSLFLYLSLVVGMSD